MPAYTDRQATDLFAMGHWCLTHQSKFTWLTRVFWWVAYWWISRGYQWNLISSPDGEPYLLRIYLWRGWGPHLYLHFFFRSDFDRDLHNHPWVKALSLIMTQGYSETRVMNDWGVKKSVAEVGWKECKPGSLNYITHDTFHRVTLLGTGCWTLFLTWGRRADVPFDEAWGFWNPDTDVYESARERGAYP